MDYSLNHSNSLTSIIRKGKEQLKNAQISNAQKEIEWFLDYKFSISLYNIKMNQSLEINDSQIKAFNTFLSRRIKGEPFQYIIKNATFYGYDFIVDRNTLIPRPETETIITVIKKYRKFNQALDIGTGSGNIAITLSLEKAINGIDAIDICSKALNIANKNKQKHKTKNVNLIQQNIFNKINRKSYDLIISNPPYISKLEYSDLDKHIRLYEPQIALTDNNQGLDFYKFFSKNLFKILKPKGKIILEIGTEKNKAIIEKLFIKNDFQYKWHKDLNGDYRVIELYK